jgi:hypothetical protein
MNFLSKLSPFGRFNPEQLGSRVSWAELLLFLRCDPLANHTWKEAWDGARSQVKARMRVLKCLLWHGYNFTYKILLAMTVDNTQPIHESHHGLLFVDTRMTIARLAQRHSRRVLSLLRTPSAEPASDYKLSASLVNKAFASLSKRSVLSRRAADDAIRAVCHAMGLTPWYLNLSVDGQPGDRGMTVHRFANDHLLPPRNDPIRDTDAIVCIDDANYLSSMDSVLRFGRPVFVFDFSPVGVTTPRYSYSFNGDTVHFQRAGSGSYEHKVWNFAADSRQVVQRFDGNYTVFNVISMRHHADPNKLLVAYLPLVTIPWWQGATVTTIPRINYCLPGSTTERGMVVAFRVADGEDSVVVGRVGAPTFNILHVETLTGLLLQSDHSGPDNKKYMVASAGRIGKATGEDTKGAAPLLLAMLLRWHVNPAELAFVGGSFNVPPVNRSRSQLDIPDPANTPGTPPALGGPDSLAVDAKGYSLPSAVENPAFVHSADKHNEQQAFDTRLAANLNETPFTPSDIDMADWFVKRVVGDRAGSVFPESFETMLANKTLPAEKRSDAAAFLMTESGIQEPIPTFLKLEVAGGGAAARIICNVHADHNNWLGSCVHGLTSALKDFPAFTSGLVPDELELSMTSVATAMEGFNIRETDYSKFDATVSPDTIKYVSNALFLELIHPSTRAELEGVLAAEVGCLLTGRFGTKLSVAGTNLSGSAATTLRNSIHNAFLNFMGLVAAGVEREQAFTITFERCRFMGDDGVCFVPEGKDAEFAQEISRLGYQVKLIDPGRIPVFVGRYWYLDWPSADGRIPSSCTPLRAFTNLAASSNRDGHWSERWLEKATARLVTDTNTPGVTAWCEAVVAGCTALGVRAINTTPAPKEGAAIHSYSQHKKPHAPPPRDASLEQAAKDLGVPSCDILLFESICRGVVDRAASFKDLNELVAALPTLATGASKPKVKGLYGMIADQYVPLDDQKPPENQPEKHQAKRPSLSSSSSQSQPPKDQKNRHNDHPCHTRQSGKQKTPSKRSATSTNSHPLGATGLRKL